MRKEEVNKTKMKPNFKKIAEKLIIKHFGYYYEPEEVTLYRFKDLIEKSSKTLQLMYIKGQKSIKDKK